ncbi:D-arabinono-1,4-lactone oxidase [Larkinella soli]|uniref:D-arabinono-1,4-lactone oxidase n=1 Tax=Larkinella soli TaxID=1770527 RepID=UPI000FFB45CE|nr:D-arabinono-1,4-lactone oxidase [Larkinella soli]
MKKRTFLKLSSAAMAAPMLAPLTDLLPAEKLKNWAGNYEYGTTNLYSAKTLDQVKAFVKKEEKFKVLGTRHCFNGIADSDRQFLSVLALEEAVDLDKDSQTVTVPAGVKYGQLAPVLEKRGFALHNLASLPHISVAGACATATHGSGVKNGNLSTAVTAMELVTAKGEVVQLSRTRDKNTFEGAVVHLGGLGVVTKVTLQVQPTFQMRQYVYENLPLDQLKDHFEEIMSAGYSVSLFTDWQKKRISEVWVKNRMGKDKDRNQKDTFFGATPAKRNLHPIVELSAENCTEQMGVAGPWYERLPHFKMGFTPSSGKELQSEYFVDRKNAVEAILAVEKLRNQVSPHLFITELRTIDKDNFWLSPCYERASLAIHFTWKQDWPAVRKLLPVIERELAPFQARPHWGKLFTLTPDRLESLYPKMQAFRQLVKQYDPKGKFRNEFLGKTVLPA